MKTITHKEFRKYLKKAEYIIGKFPEKSPNYDQSGFQLHLGWRIPLKANNKPTGDYLTETITIDVTRGGFAPKCEHFAHWSYGEADTIRILLTEESKKAEKLNREIQLDVGPCKYGSERHEVSAAIPGTDTPRKVYTLTFRNLDAWIQTYGSIESAHTWNHTDWYQPNTEDNLKGYKNTHVQLDWTKSQSKAA